MLMSERLRTRFGKTAFVMGPGGTRGAWAAGALIPFKQYGILPDFIASCSVGSLNAAAIVESLDCERPSQVWSERIHGHSDIFEKNPMKRGRVLSDIAEGLRELQYSTDRRTYLTKALSMGAKVLWNYKQIWKAPSLLSSEPLRQLMHGLDYEKIVNSPIEFEIICANRKTSQKAIFSNRNISDPEMLFNAVMASASISGIFPPIEINGEFYVDGSPADALPIINALDQNCKTIFVFCLHPQNKEIEMRDDAKQNFIFKYLPESARNYLNMQDAHFSNYETNVVNIAKKTPADIYVLRPKEIPKHVETLFINDMERDWMIEDGKKTAENLLRDELNLAPIE